MTRLVGGGITADALPGYLLVREISRGGQAVVFEAVQKSTGRKVALKVLREGPFATANERARFDREVRVLAALDHPGIVRVVDRGMTAHGSLFLVMDFVNGRPLDDYLADRRAARGKAVNGDVPAQAAVGSPVDPTEVLRLFVKMCEAVNAAHLRKITHRDLKPSNILVDADGEPHVVDFGLAHPGLMALVGENPDDPGSATGGRPLTVTGQFLGSLPWASPEQAEGAAGKVDPRSDVYSLGVILYGMLTGGHFPYAVAGTMRDVLNNILTARPTPPSQMIATRGARDVARARRLRRLTLRRRRPIHPQLEAVVLKALAKRREDRYQSAGEFGRDVANVLVGRPVTAASAGYPNRGRRTALAAGGCGLLLLLLMGLTFRQTHWRRGPAAVIPSGPASLPSTPVAGKPPVAGDGISKRPSAQAPGTRPGRYVPGVGRVVDLMPLVDPNHGTIRGHWALDAGELRSDATSPALLDIPFDPPAEYDLRTEFTLSHYLFQHLSHAGRDFFWSVGKSGEWSGFETVGPKHVQNGPPAVRLNVEPGAPHVSLVQVRNNGLKAYLDGELVVALDTDYRELGQPFARDGIRLTGGLGVGSFGGSGAQFHKIELIEISAVPETGSNGVAPAATTSPVDSPRGPKR